MSVAFAQEQLLGQVDTHVVALDPAWSLGPCRLHPLAVEGLHRLRAEARAAGFDLRVVSGFRSFQRQAEIWNEKASGLRPVLDADERPVDIAALTSCERVFAILRWSALPGASRHHWGSDMDVVDAAAIGPDYRVTLTRDETTGSGPFAPMHRWLDAHLATARAGGFFRPYTGVGCEVAPEPWHLSFAPLARECQGRFDPVALCRAHREAGLALQPFIEQRCDEILRRFFHVPASLYPPAAAGGDPAGEAA